MTTTTGTKSTDISTGFPVDWTLADLQRYLGDVSLERIRLLGPPGTATVEHALYLDDRGDCLCELVDGVLVEKVMGTYESMLAGVLIHVLHAFLEANPLGIVLAPDGMLRMQPDRIRMPDVSFIRWERFPDGRLPDERVFSVAPDLAVEIMSEGNTPREMELKLHEYFTAGVCLVWYIDPRLRAARVYTSPEQTTTLHEADILDGADVLPGFQIRLGDLFARVKRQPPSSR